MKEVLRYINNDVTYYFLPLGEGKMRADCIENEYLKTFGEERVLSRFPESDSIRDATEEEAKRYLHKDYL